MDFKRRVFTFTYVLIAFVFFGCHRDQNIIMNEIRNQFPNAAEKVIYRSNLNMLNFENNESFERLIYDIEKITLLKIDKSENQVSKDYSNQIKDKLIIQNYHELVSLKHKGYRVNIYGKENNSEIEAYFLLINNDDAFMVLDIFGSIPLQHINSLIENIQFLENLILNNGTGNN